MTTQSALQSSLLPLTDSYSASMGSTFSMTLRLADGEDWDQTADLLGRGRMFYSHIRYLHQTFHFVQMFFTLMAQTIGLDFLFYAEKKDWK